MKTKPARLNRVDTRFGVPTVTTTISFPLELRPFVMERAAEIVRGTSRPRGMNDYIASLIKADRAKRRK